MTTAKQGVLPRVSLAKPVKSNPPLTKQERDCLNGRHVTATLRDGFQMSYEAMPVGHGYAQWNLKMCRHCRCVFL